MPVPAPDAPTFDLQAHSVASDGELEPGEVVRRAAQAGVELLALSDHDTVEGVEEALRAGEREGVRVVTAVELSAVDGSHEDLHVLGYLIDHRDATLAERLADARADRVARIEGMAAGLRAAGLELDGSLLDSLRDAGRPVGRPHLARAVLAAAASAPALADAGIDPGVPDAVGRVIERWLVPGAPAYVPRTRPRVETAIEWVHEAGGVAVWAHPFWNLANADAVATALDRYARAGLDGVEAFYPWHDAEQTALLADRAEALGLLSTGSTDFHGPGRAEFSAFRGFSLYGREPRLGPIAG